MINYAPHETSTAPWKLLWWRTSALAHSRKSISVWLTGLSSLSSPVLSWPVLADYPYPSLYLLSGARLWSTEHIGAAGRALQLRLLWRINRVSLFLSLLLSLFPSLTPSPAQAVNFYWFQWARICTVIAQAGHGRTRLTRRATRQGAPA